MADSHTIVDAGTCQWFDPLRASRNDLYISIYRRLRESGKNLATRPEFPTSCCSFFGHVAPPLKQGCMRIPRLENCEASKFPLLGPKLERVLDDSHWSRKEVAESWTGTPYLIVTS